MARRLLNEGSGPLNEGVDRIVSEDQHTGCRTPEGVRTCRNAALASWRIWGSSCLVSCLTELAGMNCARRLPELFSMEPVHYPEVPKGDSLVPPGKVLRYPWGKP